MPSTTRSRVSPWPRSYWQMPEPTTYLPTPNENGKDRIFLLQQPYPDAYGAKPGHDGIFQPGHDTAMTERARQSNQNQALGGSLADDRLAVREIGGIDGDEIEFILAGSL